MEPKAATVERELPVRFSHLRAYGRSAMHGHYARTTEWKPTAPMLLGTAVHKLALNIGAVIAYPGKVRRGSEWEAFRDSHADSQILTAAEFAKATAMAEMLAECDIAREIMNGIAEETILFDWYGRKCRATPDVRGKGFVTDLKTCQTSDPEKFVWSSLRFAYHAQMRMQCEAAKVDIAYIVAIESTEPYPVTVFRVTDEALAEGEKSLSLWMERLITCEASNSYPPYSQSILPLDVPRNDELDYSGTDSDDDVPPLEL